MMRIGASVAVLLVLVAAAMSAVRGGGGGNNQPCSRALAFSSPPPLVVGPVASGGSPPDEVDAADKDPSSFFLNFPSSVRQWSMSAAGRSDRVAAGQSDRVAADAIGYEPFVAATGSSTSMHLPPLGKDVTTRALLYHEGRATTNLLLASSSAAAGVGALPALDPLVVGPVASAGSPPEEIDAGDNANIVLTVASQNTAHTAHNKNTIKMNTYDESDMIIDDDAGPEEEEDVYGTYT